MIENTTQRQKAQEIYDTFFNPESNTCLDFGLLDTLEFYGAIDKKQCKKLDKKFIKIAENLFYEMKKYDILQLLRLDINNSKK